MGKILRKTFKEQYGIGCVGFIWFQVSTRGGNSIETFGSINALLRKY